MLEDDGEVIRSTSHVVGARVWALAASVTHGSSRPSFHRWTVRPQDGVTRPAGALSQKRTEEETQGKPTVQGQSQEEEPKARIKNI